MTEYLTDFKKKVTNARGYATTYSFQAFDTPSEEAITSIVAPHTVVVGIDRDAFGKPSSITRSGTFAGQAQSVARHYVYDNHQRLCKTVEPETLATVQAYDAAGNVAWRASGQNLTALTGCDQSSVPTAAKISYAYDAEDRLKTTAFGDGSQSISRTYTPDGLPRTISTSSITWTLGYNNRRLMTDQTFAFVGGSSYAYAHGINANGHQQSLSYFNGLMSVDYAPNALGQPTQVGGFITDVAYHPNGAVAGYTYGNGRVFSASQNERGLPLAWQHQGVSHDAYSYDANGNVAAISDLQVPSGTSSTSRSMAYDGLDRLSSATGRWGTGTFGYDALDNLRSTTVGSRTTTTYLNANNLITSLSVNGSALALAYDANGNLLQRGTQTYAFDIGNRQKSAAGKASYAYDGLGRRSWVSYANGQGKIQVYSQEGQLLFSYRADQGSTHHVYLGSTLVAEVNSVTGTRYMHADALGSPIARTSSTGGVVDRTSYEPYGATVAGTTNPDGIGFTGHVNDPDTGLVYMQQRYYDPIAGRFLSVDPVTTDSGSGQHFNRYVYALNNPYKYNDPDGRLPNFVLGALVGAGIEAVVQYRTTGSVNAAGVIGAAVAGAITGGMSGMLSKGVVQNVISAGTATGKTALVGAASGVVGKHVEGAISGKTPSGTDLAVAAAGGALGAGAGAKITNSAVGAVQAEAAKAGVAGHIGQTTMNAIATGGPAAVRSSAGQEIAKTGIEAGTAYAGEKLKQASQ